MLKTNAEVRSREPQEICAEQVVRGRGLRVSRLATLALSLAALGSVSCATKTATLHSTPFFTATPNREAINAVDAGDGDLEIASLRRTMMSRADDVDARLRLAQAYALKGFPDVALEHYRLAAERFPESLKAFMGLALILHRMGQKEEALACLNAFLHAHPQPVAEPYEWQGILSDDVQNWKASQRAYETALLYTPSNSPTAAELHNNLGYALLMQFQHSAAAVEFGQALRIKHDFVIARNNLGIALATNPTGDRKDAILNWQAVSGPASAHNNMAALLIERGDYPAARKELETALGYDQQNAQAIYNLALVAERDGKPAVLPKQNAQVKSARQFNPVSRFFHSLLHSPAQAESQTVPAGPTADRAVVHAGSGSGN
jgi:tetratricopeptide (TPR) repeat protein